MTISSSKITPCIWLDDQAEQAAAFYVRTFPAGRIVATSRYPESIDNPGGKPRGSVLTVELEVAGQSFTTLNGGPMFKLNPSVSFFFHVDTAAEADRFFAALADGGEALMPLDAYPWSERYGWVRDRFGVSWQIIAGRRPAGGAIIAPCLMFTGPQHGRAEDRFGLSWQVVPTTITEWMASTDTVARDRAFAAMLGMKKLDSATLERAFEGR